MTKNFLIPTDNVDDLKTQLNQYIIHLGENQTDCPCWCTSTMHRYKLRKRKRNYYIPVNYCLLSIWYFWQFRCLGANPRCLKSNFLNILWNYFGSLFFHRQFLKPKLVQIHLFGCIRIHKFGGVLFSKKQDKVKSSSWLFSNMKILCLGHYLI